MLKDKKKLLILFVGLFALVLGVFLFNISSNDEPQERIETTTSEETEKLQEEVEELPEVKQPVEQNENKTEEETEQPSNATHVIPQITTWGGTDIISVHGFVPGIAEDGGNCTYKLLKANGKLLDSDTSLGFIDVSKTTCPPGTLDSNGMTGLSIILEYSSDTYSGSSPEVEI